MALRKVNRALPWALTAAGTWLGYQVLRQNGRILLRLDHLDEALAALAAAPPAVAPSAAASPVDASAEAELGGLLTGWVLQDFELEDMAGGTRTLSSYRGLSLLLLFFDPSCAFCKAMLPELAALVPAEGLQVLIVTTGDAAESRALFAPLSLRFPVLLQEDLELATLYYVPGTPMGYLVDERGVTLTGLVVGAPALLALARAGNPSPAAYDAAADHPAEASLDGDSPPRELEHLLYALPVPPAPAMRDAVVPGPGDPAPDFTLPRLDAEGLPLSLATYRGRTVLLVFSDPDCAPCDLLLPDLERIHRTTPGVQVLLISRGITSANRAKVAGSGITFPVVLQRHLEISRAYGTTALPTGYLIDAHGVLLSGAGIGRDAILDLLGRVPAGDTHH